MHSIDEEFYFTLRIIHYFSLVIKCFSETFAGLLSFAVPWLIIMPSPSTGA